MKHNRTDHTWQNAGKVMGYVSFPWIEQPHAFKTCTTTLNKLCTDKTHTPKTADSSENAHARGTMPKTIHVHKSESSKATQIKQSKQTDEPVVSKIKWNVYKLS